MHALLEKSTTVPDHVPPHLVRDFDLHDLPGMVGGETDDVHLLWKKVQDSHPDIFWTPRYGGYWTVTRYDPMLEMMLDPGTFSSRELFIPRNVQPELIPIDRDPPEHGKFRRLIMPAFTPENINRSSEVARKVTIDLIEKLQPRGQCEFMSEFAGTMPIVTFLSLINLPLSDMDYLVELSRKLQPNHPERELTSAEVDRYWAALIELRRVNPQDDLFSQLLEAEVDGRPVTHREVMAMVRLVGGVGFDSVVLTTGFAAALLARNPHLQRELADHPERMDQAVEEVLRCCGVTNMGRLVTRDVEFHGVELRKGDFVQAIFPLAGWDERVNDNPTSLDFSRKGRKHLVFGAGPHVCIGNRLAKREIAIFLEEWLARIPSFRLAGGTRPRTTSGVMNFIHELHLEWDPV